MFRAVTQKPLKLLSCWSEKWLCLSQGEEHINVIQNENVLCADSVLAIEHDLLIKYIISKLDHDVSIILWVLKQRKERQKF